MRTRPRWLLLGFAALMVLALFFFPVWWPLVVGRQPEILFPGVSAEEQILLETMHAVNPTHAAAMYIYGTQTVVPEEAQAMPEVERPIIVARGTFVQIDELYWVNGEALLFKGADNSYFLRLEKFSVRNGPNLHVLLSLNPASRTRDDLDDGAGAIDLGALIGSEGDQNYPVEGSIDLNLYQSAVLYSQTLDTVFGVAPLEPVGLE